MRRRTILVSLALATLILTITGAAGFALLKHKPNFYMASAMPEGEDRRLQAGEFESRETSLINSVSNRYPDWWGVFTTEQMNSFLQERLVRLGGDNNLPDGFHDLRVQVEDGKLRLGCRYGNGFFSTIMSVEIKMWLVANEVNLIGLEIVKLRAGAIPLSRQVILDDITEAARRANIEVRWYHRKSNPVAVLRLQAEESRPTIQIQRFELQAGKIVVVGRSTDNYGAQSPK
jgi:hypothetical protein